MRTLQTKQAREQWRSQQIDSHRSKGGKVHHQHNVVWVVRRRDDSPQVQIVAWRGSAARPFANYVFRSPDRAAIWLRYELQEEMAKAKYAAERKAERTDYTVSLVVGDILNTSWGYDQTNVDFFQVVKLCNKTAWLREIAARSMPDSQGFMSDSVRPTEGDFTGPIFKKRILSPGSTVKIGGNHAHKWSGGDCYRSWYA